MTIYVDEIKNYGNFEMGGKWCHLMTDGDIQELHDFALSIGLRLEWFMDNPLHPHYDLRPSKRRLAVKNGAIEVSSKELVKKCSKYFVNK